ncbi:MAG: hemerythrin domain-containing protein [archaeon]
MMPIAFLMVEHRLIERMIRILARELESMKATRLMKPDLISLGADFMRNYTEKHHHGEEEAILFKALSEKNISSVHTIILGQLIAEHLLARKDVGVLIDANQKYVAGDKAAVDLAINALTEIVNLYPKHIAKEDKEFFIPVMNYFTAQEQEKMITALKAYDVTLDETKYKKMVEELELNQTR